MLFFGWDIELLKCHTRYVCFELELGRITTVCLTRFTEHYCEDRCTALAFQPINRTARTPVQVRWTVLCGIEGNPLVAAASTTIECFVDTMHTLQASVVG